MSSKRKIALIDEVFSDMGNTPPKIEAAKAEAQAEEPKAKETGDYFRVTVVLPKDMVESLGRLALERKLSGKSGKVSGIVREAVQQYLDKL